ncbi:MAG: glycosyltransferase family 4 protein [Clostridia bacterium]|nr:glycosyltransferase family 1 protein [bacterium]
MQTIAIFSGYYLPHLGGVERYTYNLAKKLKNMGYKIIIVTSRYDENLKEIEDTEYAKIFRLPTYKIVSSRYPINKQNKRCKELLEMVKQENVNSAIIQTRFWTTSYIASKFISKNNIPACLIEHGSTHFTVNNKILDFFGEKYEHILTNSIKKRVKDYYGVSKKCTEWLKHFNIEAKGVFYNSVNSEEIEEYSKFINKDTGKINITYTGRMIEEKGVLRLIDAFKNLNEKYDNLELSLAGEGPILEKIIQENKDIKNIHILGKISHDEVMKLLGRTNIFVNPSHFSEGLPTTILEAGLMECAVVATPMGGTTEIISDDSLGYICGFETQEIQEKIEKLINEPEIVKDMSIKIKQKVKEQFSWDITAKKIAETIKYI